MKANNEIPLSVLYKENYALVYFDILEIKNPDIIESAYILVESEKKNISENKVHHCLNKFISDNEWENIKSSFNIKKYIPYEIHIECIDITEKMHMLTSGMLENKGIVLRTDNCQIGNCTLYVKYRKEDIISYTEENIFYEKEMIISSKSEIVNSPWILTKLSKVVSFYIKNISAHEVTVYLQNSPNAVDYVDDPQRLVILPKETGLIIPYAFSKYIRIIAVSEIKSIVTKFWFQTQIIK